MDIYNKMSNVSALFAYLSRFKDSIRMQVILHDPTNLLQAMFLAEQIDSTMKFAGNHQNPQ